MGTLWPVSGWWTGHRDRYILTAICAAYVVLVAIPAIRHGPAWDEYGHLPAGILHWRDGDYRPYRTNPPLVRMVAALGVLTEDIAAQLPPAPAGRRPEWPAAQVLVQRAGPELVSYYARARLVLLPLLLVGPVCVWLWAKSLWGRAAGLAAAVLYCTSPTVLANSALMTPDATATALGVAAVFCYRQWLRDVASLRRAILAGLVLGAAVASKFTMLLLVPFWFLFPLWLFGRNSRSLRLKGLTLWLVQVALATLVVNAVYRFDGTGVALGALPFQSERMQALVRCAQSLPILAKVPVPLPAQFLLGLDEQLAEFDRGYWSYLSGTWKFGGWWYYYVYGLAIKETTALWVLFAWALLRTARIGVAPTEATLTFGPPALILAVLSAHTGFSHHIRYALPALPFVIVWAAAPLSSTGRGSRDEPPPLRCRLTLALVAAAVVSSLSQWPHSESFFSWLVGGPKQGAHYLLDSNIDWGQDVAYLARWLEEHPNEHVDGIVASVPFPVLEAFGLQPGRAPVWRAYRTNDGGVRLIDPSPGRYAVFVRLIYERWGYHYLRFLEPRVWVTPAVRIYEVTADDIDRLRPHMQSCRHRFPPGPE